MYRSISKNALFGLAAVIVGVTVSATTAMAQVEQPSQITIQGTALVTKSSNDQIPSHEATKSGGFLVGYSYQFSRWFVRGVRPYVLGGGGALVFDPTEKFIVTGAQRQTRGAFVYGGGANFDVTHNFGLRAEYRGFVYKVPDFTLDSLNVDKFTHLAQPSVGFFFRF